MNCSDCEKENPFSDLEEATENGWFVWSLEVQDVEVKTYDYDYSQRFAKCAECFAVSNMVGVAKKLLEFVSSNVEGSEICLTVDVKEVEDE